MKRRAIVDFDKKITLDTRFWYDDGQLTERIIITMPFNQKDLLHPMLLKFYELTEIIQIADIKFWGKDEDYTIRLETRKVNNSIFETVIDIISEITGK